MWCYVCILYSARAHSSSNSGHLLMFLAGLVHHRDPIVPSVRFHNIIIIIMEKLFAVAWSTLVSLDSCRNFLLWGKASSLSLITFHQLVLLWKVSFCSGSNFITSFIHRAAIENDFTTNNSSKCFYDRCCTPDTAGRVYSDCWSAGKGNTVPIPPPGPRR